MPHTTRIVDWPDQPISLWRWGDDDLEGRCFTIDDTPNTWYAHFPHAGCTGTHQFIGSVLRSLGW